MEIKGMALYDQGADAYGNTLMLNEMQKLKAMGASHVGCTVYFSMNTLGDNAVFYAGFNPTKEWLRQFIRNAHGLGLKVVFKPHVNSKDGRWAGRIYPTDWNAWFQSYETLLVEYAQLCQEEGVEILSVGNELSSSTGSDERFFTGRINETNWRNLIVAVRAVFSGKLTCAMTAWQVFDDSFPCDALDYVGINGYVPVSRLLTDTVEIMVDGWETMSGNLNRGQTYSNWKKWFTDLQAKYGKPLLFTEQAYFELFSNVSTTFPNIQEQQWQANCFEAFFRVWATNPNVVGVLVWDWCAKERAIVAKAPWVYNTGPQDKLAEQVVKTWYAYLTPISPILPIAAPLAAGLILTGLSLVKRRG